MSRGFTLLEVLVAVTILGLALVTLMQLTSHGLRLLRHADDYQQATLVADRVARAVDVVREGVASGRDGAFLWERRVALVEVPEQLTPGAGPKPRLYSLSIAVRWGGSRSLELATLRAVPGTSGQ
jgi:prepilin-type N-terminal cleavage/methylation domain-containing protein